MAVPATDRVECHYFDFDTGLAPIYDPYGQILHVVNELEDAEQGRVYEFSGRKKTSQSTSTKSKVLDQASQAVEAADSVLTGMKDIVTQGVPPSVGAAAAAAVRPIRPPLRLPKGGFAVH